MTTLIIDGIFLTRESCEITKNNLKEFNRKIDRKIFSRVVFIQNGLLDEVCDSIKNVVTDNASVSSVLKIIEKESKNADTIVIIKSGNPFFDPEFINTMIERHVKYVADYTYGIGYPDWLLPQILSQTCLKNINALASDISEEREDYVFYSISKDINSFDIETFISPADLRLARLSFSASDNGTVIFLNKLLELFGYDKKIDEITEYLSDNRELYYSTIYAAFFEISNVSSTDPIYYPEKEDSELYCSYGEFADVLSVLKSINSEMKIVFNGRGDFFSHPEYLEFLKKVCGSGFQLVIETDGYKVSDQVIDDIKEFIQYLTIVIKVDAYDNNTYKIIHRAGDISIPMNLFEKLKERGFSVYKQIVRMNENEDNIEFLAGNKKLDGYIIRKYSDYCGRLKDRKVVDLSPVKRFECYHLRREIAFTPDLKIKLCTQSNETADVSLDRVLEYYKNEFTKQTRGEYNKCCADCDDYYIFNF